MSLILYETGRKCTNCNFEIENYEEFTNSKKEEFNYTIESFTYCECCGPERTGGRIEWPLEICLDCAEKEDLSREYNMKH